MNFQYYETLLNKSNENILYVIKQIAPFFTKGELPVILDDLTGKESIKKHESKKFSSFLEIGGDLESFADISNLNSDQLTSLYKVFISNEINDKFAIKWRFYQHLKFMREFFYKSIFVNQNRMTNEQIDFILKIDEKRFYFIVCLYILDSENYNNIVKSINDFAEKEKINPEKIIIATSKTYRNIPISQDVNVRGINLKPEFYVEWIDTKKPFNGDDLILVNINNITKNKVAGFNFSSIPNLLDYVYESSEGGQISVFRQVGFFSEAVQKSKPQIELIWKGIMIKEKI